MTESISQPEPENAEVNVAQKDDTKKKTKNPKKGKKQVDKNVPKKSSATINEERASSVDAENREKIESVVKVSKWAIVRQWLLEGKLKRHLLAHILEQNILEPKKSAKDKKGKRKGDKQTDKKESVMKQPPEQTETLEPGKPKCHPDFQSIEEQESFERVACILKERRALQAALTPPQPSPKKSTKKLSKKQKKLQKQEEWQQLLRDVAAFRIVLLEEERLQRIRERASLEEKEDVMVLCHEMRKEHLRKIQQMIESIVEAELELESKVQEDYKWEKYRRCDGLHPNVTNCGELNTYIHRWQEYIKSQTMENALRQTNVVMVLIDELINLIENPANAESPLKDERIRIVKELNDVQVLSLEMATYYLLRDIRERMILDQVRIGRYSVWTNYFTLCIWTKVLMPKPLPDPKFSTIFPTKIEFEEANATVILPTSIDHPCFSVSLLWLKYDRQSYKCHTYNDPELPPELNIDLERYTRINFEKRQVIKYERRDGFIPQDPKVSETVVENDDRDEETKREEALLYKISYDREPQPLPSVMVIAEEDAEFERIKNGFVPEVAENEINLRKFWIVGGTFQITLLKQPPQPQKVYRNATATTLQLPAQLSEISFRFVYVDPVKRLEDLFLKFRQKTLSQINIAGSFDESAFKRRKSSMPKRSIFETLGIGISDEDRTEEEFQARELLRETELNKMIHIFVTLPENVLWNEKPWICYWCVKTNSWREVEMKDVKFDLTTLSLSFRASFLKKFGFAIER